MLVSNLLDGAAIQLIGIDRAPLLATFECRQPEHVVVRTVPGQTVSHTASTDRDSKERSRPPKSTRRSKCEQD